jgi:prepilin-type N-terminal cleavage/methylation domain-containing protein
VSRLADEGGFTLIELLVAMSIGLVVLLGAFSIADQALPAGNRVADRVAAQARGRAVLEQILAELRSTVCVQLNGTSLPYQSPFDATSDGSQVTFYMQRYAAPTGTTTTADPGRGGTFAAEKHRLQFSGGTLVDTVLSRWDATTSTWVTTSLPAAKTVVTKAQQLGATPYFTYKAYDASSNLVSVATPVSTADLQRIVRVDVAMKVAPMKDSTATTAAQYAEFQDGATVPLPIDFTDATSTQKGPQCTF